MNAPRIFQVHMTSTTCSGRCSCSWPYFPLKCSHDLAGKADSFRAVCGAKGSLKDRPAILRDEGLRNALLQIVDAALPIQIRSRYLRHNVRPFVRPRWCEQVETLCVLRVSMRGVARSGRFELPTPRFVVWCSIQLSYERFVRRRMKAPPKDGAP